MIAKINPTIVGVAVLLMVSGGVAYGQCADVTISGAVYSGTGTVTYTLDAIGEPIVHRNGVMAPAAPALTAANGTKVMIQDMEDGSIVTYGTFVAATNGWTACVPAGRLYIAMFSADAHNLTSRVYDLRGDAFIQGTETTMIVDAYLPALHMNITTGVVDPVAEPAEPLGNILVYAFEENSINGAPDWPKDPSLPGTVFELLDPRTGNPACDNCDPNAPKTAPGTPDPNWCCGTSLGGTGAPTAITTKDGLNFTAAQSAGMYYFEDIVPGEYLMRATPPATTDGAGDLWTHGWYHTYTMEGTQEWEVLVYPGDPGTELGAFLVWFGFAKKIGQIGDATNPCSFAAGCAGGGSTITGTVDDADLAWEAAPAGCVWPTNWDPDLCEPPEAGAPLDPVFINQGVSAHGPVTDGFLVLHQRIGDDFFPRATTETDGLGEFAFHNVPAGTYFLFFVDKPLKRVFGEIQVTVDGVTDLNLPKFVDELTAPNLPMTLSPRFGARLNGFVVDGNDVPIAGATVNLRYQPGNVAFSTVTDAVGWYEFDFLGEIEVMAMLDVEPPPGYRGKLVTETYWPQAGVPPDPTCTGFENCPIVADGCNPGIDPGCVICGYDANNAPILCTPANGTVIQRNGMNRWVQYYTANYKSTLYLESVPATVGHISGLVHNDTLAMGTWLPDGVYDNVEEGVVERATIELLDAAGGIIPLIDPVTLLPVIDPITLLPVQDPATITTSGAYDSAVAVAQGYIEPGVSVPPDEWGGFFSGPMPGYYEFRDVAPGTYTVRLTLPTGFHAPGETAGPLAGQLVVDRPVTIGGATDLRNDYGIHTLVPQAGSLDGAIFDDLFLDHRWYSAMAEEKQVLVGLGVIVRDYLGYTIDTLVQPSAICYPGTTPADPNVTPLPYGAICDRPDLGQDVGITRLLPPGLHLYLGNDPALPECDATKSNAPCHDPTLFTLELPYTMNQGGAKYEADWSLPAALNPPPPPGGNDGLCAEVTGGSSSIKEGTKWQASIDVHVTGPFGNVGGAEVLVLWSTGDQSAAITGQNGTATLRIEEIEDEGITEVTATIAAVIAPEGMIAAFDAACFPDCFKIASPAEGGATGLCFVAQCGDGVCDAGEDFCNCPLVPAGDCNFVDTDGDLVANCADICPNDPLKQSAAGICGCGTPETDSDGDLVPDCEDVCPNDPAKSASAGACGCGVAEGTCGGCVQAGVRVASLSAQTTNEGEGKWSAEVTLSFRDLNCDQPVVLDLGDEIMYRFGGGEWKQEQVNGQDTTLVIATETIEEGGPTLSFQIDHVDRPDWDPDPGNNVLSMTILRPF